MNGLPLKRDNATARGVSGTAVLGLRPAQVGDTEGKGKFTENPFRVFPLAEQVVCRMEALQRLLDLAVVELSLTQFREETGLGIG